MSVHDVRSSRLEARIHPDILTLVRRAAEMQGRSVSDFVVAAAEQAARQAIEEHQIIRLSIEDQIRFAEMLANPPEPNAALKRAQEAHRRLIVSSE